MGDKVRDILKTPTKGFAASADCNKNQAQYCENRKSKILKIDKKKRRDKSDLGEHFIAPDGGWGWLVAVASGVNILVSIVMSQQFGIIFRDHMSKLGISSSQLTSIINIQIAVSAITGLLNGPLFRRFSFRQVALFGSFLTFIGVLACAFANSFLFYCLSFSCCYGFGRGLTTSASSLAVNTYFKEKRRIASAYQFTVAGLGAIFMPFISTYLLDFLGVQGTVLIFAGLTLNMVPCSLIYQPVKWHVKRNSQDLEALNKVPAHEGNYDIIDQGVELATTALPRSNDIWFSSKSSLKTVADRNRTNEGIQLLKLEASSGEHRNSSNSDSVKELSFKNTTRPDREHYTKIQIDLQRGREREKEEEEYERVRQQLPWYMKVVIFFDLDLLSDLTYVHLAVGLTVLYFVESNFAILTPFILSDFGFESNQIATAMSLLGTFDLIIRFLIPAITAKINLSNKSYFMLGIFGMCIGRIFLSFTREFYAMLAIFIWLGLNKAFRMVFWGIIIPGYVPLKRLPAAAGLQLLISGLFSLAFGPLIGLIRDRTNFAFVLNLLNVLSLLTLMGWTLEGFVRKYKNKLHPTRTET